MLYKLSVSKIISKSESDKHRLIRLFPLQSEIAYFSLSPDEIYAEINDVFTQTPTYYAILSPTHQIK
jgi:hypothetical protein